MFISAQEALNTEVREKIVQDRAADDAREHRTRQRYYYVPHHLTSTSLGMHAH